MKSDAPDISMRIMEEAALIQTLHPSKDARAFAKVVYEFLKDDDLIRLSAIYHCPKCEDSGSILSGVCHCGASMDDHSWENHTAVELYEPCDCRKDPMSYWSIEQVVKTKKG